MLSYCLKCRKNTKSKNPKVVKTKSRKKTLFFKMWSVTQKKTKFIKGQEAWGSLSTLGIKTPLSKFPLVGPLLF